VNFSPTADVSTTLIGWFSSSSGEGNHGSRRPHTAQWSDSGQPIVGEPQLDSKRGKDVMQQLTGGLNFTMPMCVPTSGAPAASQPGHALWG
jgi:hypothetical protein